MNVRSILVSIVKLSSWVTLAMLTVTSLTGATSESKEAILQSVSNAMYKGSYKGQLSVRQVNGKSVSEMKFEISKSEDRIKLISRGTIDIVTEVSGDEVRITHGGKTVRTSRDRFAGKSLVPSSEIDSKWDGASLDSVSDNKNYILSVEVKGLLRRMFVDKSKRIVRKVEHVDLSSGTVLFENETLKEKAIGITWFPTHVRSKSLIKSSNQTIVVDSVYSRMEFE